MRKGDSYSGSCVEEAESRGQRGPLSEGHVGLDSAAGNTVEVIARLVQTLPDRVREMSHRCRLFSRRHPHGPPRR